MPTKIIVQALLCLSLAAPSVLTAQPGSNSSGEVHVRVTGRGESEWLAQNDAIRQALQQAMSQLVIADRVVSDDKVLRDTVMSTMNGFVSRYEPMRTYRSGDEIVAEVNVTVSATRMQNFLAGSSAGTSKAVRGSDLSANLRADLESRAARGEILWRLFTGYPSKVINVTIDSVHPDDRNPRLISVGYTLSTDKAFIASLKEGLKALNQVPKSQSASGSWLQRAGKKLNDMSEPRPAPHYDPGVSMVCVTSGLVPGSSPGSEDCYPLPPGDYMEKAGWPAGNTYQRLLLVVDLLDQAGQSLVVAGPLTFEVYDAGVLNIQSLLGAPASSGGPPNPTWKIAISVFDKLKGNIAIPVDKITDVSRISHIAALAATGTGAWGVCGQHSVLFDMPGCTPSEEVVRELRSRASR